MTNPENAIDINDLRKALMTVYSKRSSWDRTQIDRAANSYLETMIKTDYPDGATDEKRQAALIWLELQAKIHIGQSSLLQGFSFDEKQYKEPEVFNTIRSSLLGK